MSNRADDRYVPMAADHWRLCPLKLDKCFNAYCRMVGGGCIYEVRVERERAKMDEPDFGLIGMAGILLFFAVVVGLFLMLLWG